MIFDSLTNCAHYYTVHPRFREAFAFLERATREQLPVGRYELDGKALYAMVQEYDTKSPTENRFEGHRRYIDIQYIISGEETVEVTDLSHVCEETPYSEEKDVLFFREHQAAVRATLCAGEYGIFLPHDIHKPGLFAGDAPTPVKKIVVKVLID